jgi:hypothetical protein
MTEDSAPRIVKLKPDPEEYEEAETAFLKAVGICITQWAINVFGRGWIARRSVRGHVGNARCSKHGT